MTTPEDTRETRRSSAWPLVVVTLGLAGLATAAFVAHSARRVPADVIDSSRSLLAAFRTGTVTTRFVSYATEMSGSNYLQFATLNETERFERTDSRTVLWGQLELPDVVVRAEAPVEYTYYLDLDERWDLQIEEGTVLVKAPRIRANAPAIDVSAIRYEVEDRSMLRDEDEALRNLQQGLSKLARERARDNVSLVRELGRKKTEEFIRKWLMASYDDADRYRIVVVFEDEATPVTRGEAPR